MNLAAAPISWGVCEVPGWGYQLPADRVLADAARLGFHEIELGPPGYLPGKDAIARHGLRVVAAFVTAVLHRPDHLESELRAVADQADHLARLGGEILVFAAASGSQGYDDPVSPSDEEWAALFSAIPRVRKIASDRGLTAVLHPHVGTAIESAAAIERVLRDTDVPLCLDTGHVFIGGADPAGLARSWHDRIAHVHLKDVDATLAREVRTRRLTYADAVKRGLFRPLGDGDARIAETLAALGSYGGWCVLEQDIALAAPPTEANDPIRDVARSRDFVMAHV